MRHRGKKAELITRHRSAGGVKIGTLAMVVLRGAACSHIDDARLFGPADVAHERLALLLLGLECIHAQEDM